MKILFYNWDRINGDNAGGVSKYQYNLIKQLLLSTDWDIYYLNSGLRYDSNGFRMEQIDNEISERLRTFEIVNSPVLAPVQQSPNNLRMYMTDNTLYDMIYRFCLEQGAFDVIHFNNLEGLSLSVLRLKEDFPCTNFVYTLHNYFLICSRVNLWKDKLIGMGHNCAKKSFEDCDTCYFKLSYQAEIFKRRHKDLIGIDSFVHIWSDDFPDYGNAELYQNFEEKNILAVNRYMDVILAVSYRVREIFLSHGLDEKKIKVSRIGTKVAEHQVGHGNADIYQDPFRIIYMGYMRDSKGYYFLMEALEAMPKELSKKIALTIAAQYDARNQEIEDQHERLRMRFSEVHFLNGYTAENQLDLLQNQNLGIVPVLWEDNLPQVAIELLAYGVPVMCSNLGGTKELFSDSRFVFRAADIDDFLIKLKDIMEHRIWLKEYWNHVSKLITMEDHVEELYGYYKFARYV